jgi:DNA-directed RNA polymerase subunit RPC12/RpoP
MDDYRMKEICVDCGIEFEKETKNTRTVRCVVCRKIYRYIQQATLKVKNHYYKAKKEIPYVEGNIRGLNGKLSFPSGIAILHQRSRFWLGVELVNESY